MKPATQSALVEALSAALQAHGRGAFDEAETWLDAAARLVPSHPDLAHLRGLVALGKLQPTRAVEWIEHATRASPRTAMYWNNLGVARRAAGDLDGAALAHRRALTLNPDYASAHNNLGAVEAERGDYESAARSFDAAIKLGAVDPDTFANAALALARDECGERALAMIAGAECRGLRSARLDIARGTALVACRRYRDAIDVLTAATARWPSNVEAWHNLGYAFEKIDALRPALDALEHARALAPEDPATSLSLGMVQLALGDYRAGWASCRRRRNGPARLERATPTPFGPDLSGRRIRLCRDQGVGDDLFFLRFAPELQRRGAAVVVDVDPRLQPMLARAGFAVEGEADESVLTGDLPFRLAHERAEEAPPPLRLPPIAARGDLQRSRLAEMPRPWIAVSWRAGVRGQMKAIEPGLLGAALRGVAGTIVVVQRNPRPSELAAFAASLGREIVDSCAANEDLETMLAMMSVVDRHVAVSNTNLHLRAAAGGMTHVLVPTPAEWRWRPDGQGALPWFRDHVAYRQSGDGTWDAALGSLAGDLATA
jgi:Flp pilus assembly protein TadD